MSTAIERSDARYRPRAAAELARIKKKTPNTRQTLDSIISRMRAADMRAGRETGLEEALAGVRMPDFPVWDGQVESNAASTADWYLQNGLTPPRGAALAAAAPAPRVADRVADYEMANMLASLPMPLPEVMAAHRAAQAQKAAEDAAVARVLAGYAAPAGGLRESNIRDSVIDTAIIRSNVADANRNIARAGAARARIGQQSTDDALKAKRRAAALKGAETRRRRANYGIAGIEKDLKEIREEERAAERVRKATAKLAEARAKLKARIKWVGNTPEGGGVKNTTVYRESTPQHPKRAYVVKAVKTDKARRDAWNKDLTPNKEMKVAYASKRSNFAKWFGL